MTLDVSYRPARPSDVAPVAALLGAVFARQEPLALAVGQRAEEVESLASLVGAKAVADRLAIVAHDGGDGTVIGAAVVHDFGTAMPAGIDRLGESFMPIAGLLDQLEARYRAEHDVAPGSHAHVFMLAVRPEASGHGIARQLVAYALANAAGRGYRFAFTEATSAPSQHVFRRAGFRELCAAPYRTFEYRGRRLFASVTTPPGALLMARTVDSGERAVDA